MKTLLFRLLALPLLGAVTPFASGRGEDPAATWFYYCADSPAQATWKSACPATLDEAVHNYDLHHEVDGHGEGIRWRLAHWLEVHDPPHQRDRVPLGGAFEFRATAHVAVIREFWTYQTGASGKPVKKAWESRTVAHLTVGGERESDPVIRNSAPHGLNGKTGKGFIETGAWSNAAGAHPVIWKGKTLGWVAVSWLADDSGLRSSPWWFKAGTDDALARKTTNPSARIASGNHHLSWTFVIRRSDDGIEADLGSPGPRTALKLPPPDIP